MKHSVPIVSSRLVLDKETDDWVIIAPGREYRSDDLLQPFRACRFCPEQLERVEVFASAGKGVRRLLAIPNTFPSLSTAPGSPYGRQEIIVEGTAHDALAAWTIRETVDLLRFYGERMIAAKKDPCIKLVLLFKNEGRAAGASQVHPHSQLWATSLVSQKVLSDHSRREYLRAYTHCCPACLSVRHAESGPLVIFEDAHAISFAHPCGRFAYEVRILSKHHVDNLSLLKGERLTSLAKALHACMPLLAELKAPFNFYTQELVDDPDQHVELRLSPRLNTWAGLEISSGFFVNPVDPAEAAEAYRQAAARA